MNGDIYISKPGLFSSDEIGYKSVCIEIFREDDEVLFMIINKPSEIKIHDAIPEIPDTLQQLVGYGGGRNTDVINYLHKYKLAGSSQLTDGLYLDGKLEEFEKKVNLGLISDDDTKFFSGVCQIPIKSIKKGFIRVNLDSNTLNDWIFNKKPEELYLEATKRLGGNMLIFGITEEFSLN